MIKDGMEYWWNIHINFDMQMLFYMQLNVKLKITFPNGA